MAQLKTVLEFGTSKVICMIDSSNIKGMDLPGSSCIRYEGIQAGRFKNREAVKFAVQQAVESAEKKCLKQVHNAMIAIPASFSYVMISESEMNIDSGEVTNAHISELAELAVPGQDQKWMLADIRPVYFLTDREDLYVDMPIGVKTRKLKAMFSFVYVNKYFSDTVIEALNLLHIYPERFVSEAYAQSVHYLSYKDRLDSALILDVGYYETAVSAVYADAVLATKVVGMGGFDLVENLCSSLHIDTMVGESLKRGHMFGIHANHGNKVYGKDFRGRMVAFDQVMVKNALETSGDKLCGLVKHKIDQLVREKLVSKNSTLYLTGAGLAARGVETYLRSRLNKKVICLDLGRSCMMSPVYSTALSLLDNNLSSVYHLTSDVYQGTAKTKILKFFKT